MRMLPKDRTLSLLTAALLEAEAVGFANMTRAGIATRADVSEALISHYLGTMIALRRSVMRQAIAQERLSVIAQGLALRDKQACKADKALRDRAAASLSLT